jgi:hypothetical protein
MEEDKKCRHGGMHWSNSWCQYMFTERRQDMFFYDIHLERILKKRHSWDAVQPNRREHLGALTTHSNMCLSTSPGDKYVQHTTIRLWN